MAGIDLRCTIAFVALLVGIHAAVTPPPRFGHHMRRVVHQSGEHGASRLTFEGRMTRLPVIALEWPGGLAAMEYDRVGCNWTTLTIRSRRVAIPNATFQGEPFVTAGAEWRCRPHKREGTPLYRKVVGPPTYLDPHTVVLTVRKADIREILRGRIEILNGVPRPPLRRSMWDFANPIDVATMGFKFNYNTANFQAEKRDVPIGAIANCTDCYLLFQCGFQLTIDLALSSPVCVPNPLDPFGDDICGPQVSPTSTTL